MSELTPITRVESYLDAIVNNGIPPTEDITRIETFLQAIYDNQVCPLTPITRIEMFLGKISGQDIELPQPVTRAELYLAAIAGEDVELPENPITRLEMYLAEWADSGDWTTISGAIVEFITQRAHKLKSCVVSLSPQQDLHGYDHPWPAGGGKNKLPPLSEWEDGYINSSGAVVSPSATYKEKTSPFISIDGWTNSVAFSCVGGFPYIDDANPWRGVAFYSSASVDGFISRDSTSVSASLICSIPAGAKYIRASCRTFGGNLQLQLENSSTATSYSPFSNICPISGWTGCEVWDTGKNLFDQSSTPTIMDCYGDGGNITTRRAYKIELPSGTYIFSATKKPDISTGAYIYLNKVNADGSFGSFHYFITGSATSATFTLTLTDGQYFLLYDAQASLPTSENKFSYFDFQIELGSTATDYEPFRGNSYSVTWEDEAGTVHSGTLTINQDGSGSIKVKTLMLTDDGSSDLWTYTENNGKHYIYMSTPQEAKTAQTVICNLFKGVPNSNYSNLNNRELAMTTSPFNYINIRDDSINSISDFTSLIQNTPIQLLFTLATPVTYQLTQSQVITALKGYNAMWSDAGDVTVTVRGEPVVEPDVQPLQALNLLLGGAYHNDQTPEDVSDEEALEIILGGENR